MERGRDGETERGRGRDGESDKIRGREGEEERESYEAKKRTKQIVSARNAKAKVSLSHLITRSEKAARIQATQPAPSG